MLASQNSSRSVAPPLNSDFFTQLQCITSKHQKLIRQIIEDVVSLFGPNFSLTLEEYFTQLEFLAPAAAASPAGGPSVSAEMRACRERLMGGLAAVLEMSTDVAIRRAGGCRLHEQLVGHLQPKETVISFNYDCVLDHALRRHGAGKWSTRYGYAFPSDYEVLGEQAWDADPPASASTHSIHLLKLHGSINWKLPTTEANKEITIKQRLHSQRGIPDFTIIPPVWNKTLIEHPVFRVLWRNADRAIRHAKQIAVVGFSFTPTDLPVESLFRVALRSNNLQTLVIANPSGRDRERIRQVFSQALQAKKKPVVRQYDAFQDFVEALPECFN